MANTFYGSSLTNGWNLGQGPNDQWRNQLGNTTTSGGIFGLGATNQFTPNQTFINTLKGIPALQGLSDTQLAQIAANPQLQDAYMANMSNANLDASQRNLNIGQAGISALQNSNGTNTIGNNGNNSFSLGGATGFDWARLGLGVASGLYGMYQSNKQLKLAQDAYNEQKALNHANYRMQAQSYNNSLRNQQSGRGYIGMSGAAKRTLGAEYNARKAKEDY